MMSHGYAAIIIQNSAGGKQPNINASDIKGLTSSQA